MTNLEKKEKNKKALGAILTTIGIVLIILSIFIVFTSPQDGGVDANNPYNASVDYSINFMLVFIGTACSFAGNYLYHGYLKFFN